MDRGFSADIWIVLTTIRNFIIRAELETNRIVCHDPRTNSGCNNRPAYDDELQEALVVNHCTRAVVHYQRSNPLGAGVSQCVCNDGCRTNSCIFYILAGNIREASIERIIASYGARFLIYKTVYKSF